MAHTLKETTDYEVQQISNSDRRCALVLKFSGISIFVLIGCGNIFLEAKEIGLSEVVWSIILLVTILCMLFLSIKSFFIKERQVLTKEGREKEEQEHENSAKVKEQIIDSDSYWVGYIITWILTFIGCWIYCIATYGFLLGVGLGWLAAGIAASVVSFFWPLIILAIIGIFFMFFNN